MLGTHLSRLLEADKTLSAIVAAHGAGPSSPFMEAYSAGVGLKLGSKEKTAVVLQGDIHDDNWPVCSFHRPERGATNEEAFGLGVVTKDGVGDGTGLGLAGGLETVLRILESETDLTARELVAAARAAAVAVAHANLIIAGAAVGLTKGYGMHLNLVGGPAAIAAAASSAGVTPDELVEAHSAAANIDMGEATADYMELLLDALEVKAREDTDLIFPGSFNIRKWIKTADRPSWLPGARKKEGPAEPSSGCPRICLSPGGLNQVQGLLCCHREGYDNRRLLSSPASAGIVRGRSYRRTPPPSR